MNQPYFWNDASQTWEMYQIATTPDFKSYEVGSGKTYTTITEAINAVKTAVPIAPLSLYYIKVYPGTYNEQVIISDMSNISIEGMCSNRDQVTICYYGADVDGHLSANDAATLILYNVSNINISNITIQCTTPLGNIGIATHIGHPTNTVNGYEGVTNIKFHNCFIHSYESYGIYEKSAFAKTAQQYPCSFTNCRISGNERPIYMNYGGCEFVRCEIEQNGEDTSPINMADGCCNVSFNGGRIICSNATPSMIAAAGCMRVYIEGYINCFSRISGTWWDSSTADSSLATFSEKIPVGLMTPGAATNAMNIFTLRANGAAYGNWDTSTCTRGQWIIWDTNPYDSTKNIGSYIDALTINDTWLYGITSWQRMPDGIAKMASMFSRMPRGTSAALQVSHLFERTAVNDSIVRKAAVVRDTDINGVVSYCDMLDEKNIQSKSITVNSLTTTSLILNGTAVDSIKLDAIQRSITYGPTVGGGNNYINSITGVWGDNISFNPGAIMLSATSPVSTTVYFLASAGSTNANPSIELGSNLSSGNAFKCTVGAYGPTLSYRTSSTWSSELPLVYTAYTGGQLSIPTLTSNGSKLLASNSSANGLEWVDKPTIANLTNSTFAFINGEIVDTMGGGVRISSSGIMDADEINANSLNLGTYPISIFCNEYSSGVQVIQMSNLSGIQLGNTVFDTSENGNLTVKRHEKGSTLSDLPISNITASQIKLNTALLKGPTTGSGVGFIRRSISSSDSTGVICAVTENFQSNQYVSYADDLAAVNIKSLYFEGKPFIYNNSGIIKIINDRIKNSTSHLYLGANRAGLYSASGEGTGSVSPVTGFQEPTAQVGIDLISGKQIYTFAPGGQVFTIHQSLRLGNSLVNTKDGNQSDIYRASQINIFNDRIRIYTAGEGVQSGSVTDFACFTLSKDSVAFSPSGTFDSAVPDGYDYTPAGTQFSVYKDAYNKIVTSTDILKLGTAYITGQAGGILDLNGGGCTIDSSGILLCAQGLAGLQTDGDFGYVYIANQDDAFRLTADASGIKLYTQAGTSWIYSDLIPTSSGVATAISTHNTSNTAHTDIRNILTPITNSIVVGTTGNANGVLAKVTTKSTGNGYGRTSLDGTNFYQSYFNPTTNDTVYYTQYCNSLGFPEILKKTPSDASSVNLGSPITTGQRCFLSLNGYVGASGLGTTDVYFNPINTTYTSVHFWSGDTAYYTKYTTTSSDVQAADSGANKLQVLEGDRVIKISIAGKYKITGITQVIIGGSEVSGNFITIITKNGIHRGWWDRARSYGGYINQVRTVVLDCVAGDMIAVYINSAANNTLNAIHANLSIEKIG